MVVAHEVALMARLPQRSAMQRTALPRQGSRESEAIRIAYERTEARRRTVAHTDGDGQRIEDVVCVASADTTVRHRLGRVPRQIQIVGMPHGGSRLSVQTKTAELFTVANQDANDITVTFWVY